MKHKLINVLSIAILVILFFTGCWDASDINKKDITTTTGVGREGENYVFLGEIANLTSEGSDSPKFTVIKAYGKTFAEARENLDLKHPKPVYVGTTGILVLTIPLVKYGLEEYMYRMRVLHEYRKTLKVVTTMDDVEELLGLQKDKEVSSGTLIEAMLESLTKKGEVIHFSASEVIEWLCSENDCFVLPNIDMNENKDGFIVSGYTVVKDSVYAGFIPNNDVKGLILLLNKDAFCIVSVPFGGHEVTVEAKLKKKKIKAELKDNKISFDIDLEFKSIVKYLDDDMYYSQEDNNQVNSNLEKLLKSEVQFTINQAQTNFKCDYFGFNKTFRIKYPNIYKKMNWNDEFVHAKININIKNELDPGGEFDYDAEVLKEDKQ